MSALIAIVGTLALCIALIIFCAEGDNRDWREDWCCPECYADHRQQGPCLDCPARRAARQRRGASEARGMD